jgi:prepilin-type processing-associated H-X9-DG protein
VFPHFLVMSNELSTPKILACPEDTRICSISFAREFDDSNLSYFVGVDAAEESPSSWLAGDRNLTNRLPAGAVLLPLTTNFTIGWDKKIHSKKGNVLFGDGHVDSVLNYPPSMSGQTNRLAIP